MYTVPILHYNISLTSVNQKICVFDGINNIILQKELRVRPILYDIRHRNIQNCNIIVAAQLLSAATMVLLLSLLWGSKRENVSLCPGGIRHPLTSKVWCLRALAGSRARTVYNNIIIDITVLLNPGRKVRG